MNDPTLLRLIIHSLLVGYLVQSTHGGTKPSSTYLPLKVGWPHHLFIRLDGSHPSLCPFWVWPIALPFAILLLLLLLQHLLPSPLSSEQAWLQLVRRSFFSSSVPSRATAIWSLHIGGVLKCLFVNCVSHFLCTDCDCLLTKLIAKVKLSPPCDALAQLLFDRRA